MRYLWIGMMVMAIWLLHPGLALASCQTWTVMEGGKVKFCQQCCYPGGQCTLSCY